MPKCTFSFTPILGIGWLLVVDGGPPVPPRVAVCDFEDVRGAPWCDTSLSYEDRASALVANLTLSEKTGLFLQHAAGIRRLHWPPYNWWTEALHGVARRGLATSWPQVIGVASSFNRTLWRQLGDLTSTEGRGKAGGTGETYWAPNINIFRDPRWGRGQETPGEDPTLTAEYAVQYLNGMQEGDQRGDAEREPKLSKLKVSACLKHFSVYSQERNRQSIGVNVSAQDMEDTYLPAFEAGVRSGGATCIMCSYNAETYGYGIFGNGTQHGAIPSCANKYTMTDLARKRWGFEGYIVSDCYAVNRVRDAHHYTSTIQDTINATLSAGMDLECGNTLSSQNMREWYESGQEAQELADTALRRLFTMQLRLGWADPPEPWSNYGLEVVNTPDHQALAKLAADQSLVLLKNDNQTLPFKSNFVKKVAILGPHANATIAMQGNYYGTAPFLISPCEGFGRHAATACAVPAGCTVRKGDCWDETTREAVSAADAVVVAVGLDLTQEDEGVDRTSLLLPGQQSQLLQSALQAADGKPVVVVIMSGSAVDLTSLKSDARAQSLLWCGYPGQAGGQALADALFGVTNSFGRLPMTWYDDSFTKQVALQDYAMRPDPSRNYPGRTHRFYTGTPVYQFGAGLSYTSFQHTLRVLPLSLPAQQRRPHRGSLAAIVRVTIANVGSREGAEVVLLFGSPPGAGHYGRPRQELLGFTRVFLQPGQAHSEQFELTTEDLLKKAGPLAETPGHWRVWVGCDGQPAAQEVDFASEELLV